MLGGVYLASSTLKKYLVSGKWLYPKHTGNLVELSNSFFILLLSLCIPNTDIRLEYTQIEYWNKKRI